MAAKDVIDTCCVLLWLMSYKHTRGSQSAPQLTKGWGVCCHVYVTGAHKRRCVVHWNMPNHHTSTAMSVCVNECCIERLNERGIASYEMADLYAPQGVDLGGGGFPSRKSGMTWYRKWPKQENCKMTFENLQKIKILSVP